MSFCRCLIYVDDQGISDVVFIHLRHNIVREQQLCLIKGPIWYFQFGPGPSSMNEAHSTKQTLCPEDDSRSICPTYPGLRDLNALAVLVAINLEITLPQLPDAMIYF